MNHHQPAASEPTTRIVVSLVGAGLYSLRMESGSAFWDGELDMDLQQLLTVTRVCGVVLYHERKAREKEHGPLVPPGWVPDPGAISILTPPEMDPCEADSLHGAILENIRAGFAQAAAE